MHGPTSSDTVSSLTGKGSLKLGIPRLMLKTKINSSVFKELGNQPKDVTTEQMQKIE